MTSPVLIRQIALELLQTKDNDFYQQRLEPYLSQSSISQQDKALLVELVYGTVRHRLTLDHLISTYSTHRPSSSLLRNVLRLGLYQLLFLDRIPAYAAVDQSVGLVKKRKEASYVNALLRKVQRDIQRLPVDSANIPEETTAISEEIASATPTTAKETRVLPIRPGVSIGFSRPIFPDPATNLTRYLSLVYSYPHFLVERWLQRFGDSTTRQLLQAGNLTPPLALRLRPGVDRAAVIAQLSMIPLQIGAVGDNILLVNAIGPLQTMPGFAQGLFTVQGPTAVEVCRAVDPLPGQWILDLCAAPGGKTACLADLSGGKAYIVACDREPRRLFHLSETISQLSLRQIYPVVLEGTSLPKQFGQRFARVLVDVPCSNTAVLARRIEARWRFSPLVLANLQKQQWALLRSAAYCVAPGGLLVYSTCSLEPEENEILLERFLKRQKQFQQESWQRILPTGPAMEGGTFFVLRRGK